MKLAYTKYFLLLQVGRQASVLNRYSETGGRKHYRERFRSCVEVEVAVLCTPSHTIVVLMVSVDVEQH